MTQAHFIFVLLFQVSRQTPSYWQVNLKYAINVPGEQRSKELHIRNFASGPEIEPRREGRPGPLDVCRNGRVIELPYLHRLAASPPLVSIELV